MMSKMKQYQPTEVTEAVVSFCLSTGRKYVFLSGNGGSGKTELSKVIFKIAAKHGHTNVLDMDDFVVDTTLRENATATWNDVETSVQRLGRYTTSFPASYFLQSIKAILYNLEKGNDYYHWPKKVVKPKECRLLHADAVLTIVDGVGTVFLERDERNSMGVFVFCSPEIEIARRITRGKFSNEKNEEEVRKRFAERNSQYRSMIEPHQAEFGLVLESREDFSLTVVQDNYKILL